MRLPIKYTKKYFIATVICIAFGLSAGAQVVEINPSINWTYVRSQKMDLQGDNVYQYEFPAKTGNDYIFTIRPGKTGLYTWMKIFDIQMKPIAQLEKNNAPESTVLEFRVPASGTYFMAFGYSDRSLPASTEPIQFDLNMITRPLLPE
jgi:hypothetical protein